MMNFEEKLIEFLYDSAYSNGLIYPDGDGSNFHELMKNAIKEIVKDLLEKFKITELSSK